MTHSPPSRRESKLWRVIRVGASPRLAVFELLAIALVCAVATVCESKFDAEVAQAWFYHAPWFLFWLGLLCVNLICVTLVRWPWQRKDAGFVLTHYGIVLLLVGAFTGNKSGFETGLRLHAGHPPLESQMGFAVQLLRFEVPRDEGSGEPSDFRSTVRFTDSATGETEDILISMNHPACYPSGFWKTALGLNCKFAQAEWNPDDLGETTLQVARDPGWPLKWLGSLLLCVGMAGMFYSK